MRQPLARLSTNVLYLNEAKEVTIKALRIISNILFWLILSVEIILLILFYAPRLFNGDCFVVSSGSMEPNYPVGSLVYIEKVAPETIQVGDVVSFHLSDEVIATHEVYEIDQTNREFRTRGINNRNDNGEILVDAVPVTYEKYIGRAIFDIPFLGYLYFAIKNHILLIFTLALIIVLMLKWILVKVKYESTEVKDEK